MFDLILFMLTGLLLGFLGGVFYFSRSRRVQSFEIKNAEAKIRNLEREIFTFESEKSKQINSILIEKSNEVRKTYSDAFEVGRECGLTQGQADTAAMVTQARNELLRSFEKEREKIFEEARVRAKLEYEELSKTFSVNVQPYVRIINEDGIFSSKSESRIGYQYRLYINGIPAFEPHNVIHRHEISKKIDKDSIKFLIEEAVKIAKTAASLYLGGVVNVTEDALVEKEDR